MGKYEKNFNIRNKLIVSMLVIILVPSIFIMHYVGTEFNTYIENVLNKRTKEEMSRIDNLIEVYLKQIEENVNYLASNEIVKQADKTITSYKDSNEEIVMTPSKNNGVEQKIYNLYSQLGKSNSLLKYVYMGTENGALVQWPEGKINKKYDPRERPWYKAAIANPGKIIVTDPYYYPAGDITVVSIVKTIENEQKQIIGVQAIDLSLNDLTNMFKQMKIGEEGYLILTNEKGIIIANPNNPQMNFTNIKELNIEGFKNIDKIEPGVFETKMDGTAKFINIFTTKKTNFKLIAVIEKKEFLEQVTNIEWNILRMLFICVIIAIILAFMLSNKFSKPILIIKNHLMNIGSGDLDKNLPKNMLERKDEFGDLSVAIELMQNRLVKLIDEIIESENEVKEREKALKKTKEKIKENLNFLNILMDTIPNPIFSKDENGIYNHCNTAFQEYIGRDKDKIIGYSVYDIFSKELAEVYFDADNELLKSKGKQVYETKVVYNDGIKHDVMFNKAAILNYKGECKGVVGVMIDVTEQRSNQEKMNKLIKLKEAIFQINYSAHDITSINELLKVVLDKVIECVAVGDSGAFLILDNNKLKIAVARGYSEEDIRNFSVDFVKSFQCSMAGEDINKVIIINNVKDINQSQLLKTQDGSNINSIMSAPIIIDEKVYGFINLESSHYNAFGETEVEMMEYLRYQLSITISKHKLYEQTIYLSRHDKLTNVYNRSYFEQLVNTEIYEAIKDNKDFFVAILDLNGLKFVNDNYGHLVGDEFIKSFANELKKLGDESDIIARFGGDEFIGVFYNRNVDSLTNNLESLLKHFQDNPIIFEHNKIVCSFSYGISSFPEEGEDFNNLIKIADERMYERKKIMKAKQI